MSRRLALAGVILGCCGMLAGPVLLGLVAVLFGASAQAARPVPGGGFLDGIVAGFADGGAGRVEPAGAGGPVRGRSGAQRGGDHQRPGR